MTEAEARTFLKTHGWGYYERIRHKSRRRYVYARRKERGVIAERYICPLTQLGTLTEQELLAKLAPQSNSTF
jgi:hypothetical protein